MIQRIVRKRSEKLRDTRSPGRLSSSTNRQDRETKISVLVDCVSNINNVRKTYDIRKTNNLSKTNNVSKTKGERKKNVRETNNRIGII